MIGRGNKGVQIALFRGNKGGHNSLFTRKDVAGRPFCAEGLSVRAARTRCLSSSRKLQVKHEVAFRSLTWCAFAKRRMAITA
jgi:hypothetical protein